MQATCDLMLWPRRPGTPPSTQPSALSGTAHPRAVASRIYKPPCTCTLALGTVRVLFLSLLVVLHRLLQLRIVSVCCLLWEAVCPTWGLRGGRQPQLTVASKSPGPPACGSSRPCWQRPRGTDRGAKGRGGPAGRQPSSRAKERGAGLAPGPAPTKKEGGARSEGKTTRFGAAAARHPAGISWVKKARLAKG